MNEYINQKDYLLELQKMAVSTISFLQLVSAIESNIKKVKFEITPSVDTGIGPHLDADIFIGITGNDYRQIAHATLLSDMISCKYEERAGYIKALIGQGGEYNFEDEQYHYCIFLKRSMTLSDFVSLLAPLITQSRLPT